MLKTNFPSQKIILLSCLSLSGCAVQLPPAPALSPADPNAPAATSAWLQPQLSADARIFLAPAAGHRVADRTSDLTKSETSPTLGHQTTNNAVYFTCPMHPEIKETEPGKCPLCGMTLIRKTTPPEAKP